MSNRLIVSGTREGKEVVVQDCTVEKIDLEGVLLTTLWKIDNIPTVPNDGLPSGDLGFPKPGGLWVCTFTVPPHFTIQYQHDLVDFEPGRPGYHHTDSVDVDYITDGEIVLEIEGGSEIHLNKGDSIVVNGTGHAWHNRSDAPATVLASAYGARRINE